MLKPYIAFARKSFLNRSAYRFEHFMGILNTIVRIFIFWEIYKALYGDQMAVDGITLSMVTTNFILSIGLEGVFYINDFYLPNKIKDGSIANELLLPISIQGQMLADNLGNALFKLLYHFVPALVVSILIMGIQPPADISALFLFIMSALFGYGVLWVISYTLQMMSFWLMNVWSLVTIKNVFINIMAGSMIPLWFMPDWMKTIIDWSPFSAIYFTPVQIYLGQLSYEEIVYRCFIQIVWIIVIYMLGNLLWKKGKRKLVVQGG